jgi:hypothetical protein
MKIHSSQPVSRTALALLLLSGLGTTYTSASAQTNDLRATVTIVGDADRFNIGQDGYCGKRTEIESPAGITFEIPANKSTVFYIRSKFRVQGRVRVCEGDFSFLPEPGILHIVRYSIENDGCRLEMFHGEASSTPSPLSFSKEARRSCLVR